MSKLIAQCNKVSVDHKIRYQMSRNEYYSSFLGQYCITRKYSSPSDANWDIYTSKHHFLNIRRVISLNPCVETFNFFQDFSVTHGAIKDYTILRICIDSVAQIVSN